MAALFLPKEKSQIIVSWYINNAQKIYIPPEITDTCLTFYHLFETPMMAGVSEKNFYKTYWLEFNETRVLGSGFYCRYGSNLYIRNITRKADKKLFGLYLSKRKGKTIIQNKSWCKCITLLQKFSYCPNIINITNFCLAKKRIYIVVEIAEKGSLFGQITNKTICDNFNEFHILNIIKQIAIGLRHIHSEKYIHGSLNAYNIRYCEGIIKIGGFISCNSCNENEWLLNIPEKALIDYSSPEIIKLQIRKNMTINEKAIEFGYNMSTDIWSLGVIAYVLLGALSPFKVTKKDNVTSDFMQYGLLKMMKERENCLTEYRFPNHSNWSNVSKEAQDLSDKLLVFDKCKRLTASEILKHPWMNLRENVCKAFDGSYMKQLSQFKTGNVKYKTLDCK
eukprot:384778_1